MDYSKKLSPEVLEKVRHLELQTKKLLRGMNAGTTVSPKRGHGLEFDQLRDYELGDDIRFIDWKSSARSDKLVVRQHIYEHTPNVFIALDISASTLFGSSAQTVKGGLQEAALILIIAAFQMRAAVSLLLFDSGVVWYMPPSKKSMLRHALIEKVATASSVGRPTNIANALRHYVQMSRQEGMLFVLSDFIDAQYEKELALVRGRYDMVVLRCLDRLATAIPSVGLVHMRDPETGVSSLVNVRPVLNRELQERMTQQNKIFAAHKIDYLDLMSTGSIIDQLVTFFARRLVKTR